jgi:hypothetical protein
MKSRLQIQIPAAILFLTFSLAVAPAQPAPSRGSGINPATGLPAATSAPAIDPTTGLPVAPVAQPPSEPEWINPNWGDSNLTLPNVSYDGLPISEVAKDLRQRFNDTFDIIISPGWRTPSDNSEPMNPQDWPIKLQLRNVNAGEVFRAMNSLFEIQNAPLRWQLTINGRRPMLLLRVIPELLPRAVPPPPPAAPPETHRMVFFVGHLIGDEKSGGMTMEQVVKTIEEVWPADFGNPDGVLQFHKEAQLLVANGTHEQLEFINQTLAALGQKMVVDTNRRISADLQSRLDGVKNQRTNSPDAK